jgi:hypothetical protein
MRSRLECLLSAIAAYNKSGLPTDPAFHANNPLRLGEYEHGVATGRLKKFNSVHGGLVAGLFDLKVKTSGKSRAKLDGENFTIKGLVRVYGLKDGTEIYVARFLSSALAETITPSTPLNYFTEQTDKIQTCQID